MRVRVVSVAFLFPGRERAKGTCVVVTTLMPTHKIKGCLFSAVSFPARAVVQKALYRFVGACERSMRVRVVGVAFLFAWAGEGKWYMCSSDNFDAYA